MSEALELVAEEARTCTRCKLAPGRTNVVFGSGDPHADLMFIGEGPGAEEDRRGLPFVGRSGQLLDRLLLEELGIARDLVYITNTVKCLRYNARVQLADGTWERIGRLVRGRFAGEVMSVDGDGRLVPRRVIGWHAAPLAGRSVYRLSYKSSKAAGASTSGIQLTGDHEVLTEKGWCRADELCPGDRIAVGHGLSDVAFDVVCGSLLGDGHINASSSHLSFSHTARQATYAEHKARLLSELEPTTRRATVAATTGGERRHEIVSVRTKAHRSLRTLRADFYGSVKRIPSWLPERLSARMLAIWFMDDGYTRIRGGGRQPLSELATCCFATDDMTILVAGLQRLGVAATVRRNRLHFDVKNTRRLSELMAPYVVPSMRYKLHPEVESALPFSADDVMPGSPAVLFDEVVIEEITDSPRTDTTFFCIDVEESHNFVTAGGVVHNCRPPGNRDPEPDELAACQPYLDRQIELIAPKVIVTLGNFASRYVLGTKEGITRLRGRTYPHASGAVVVPTFHPAAVLRGGAEPMAQLRADLIRAKLVLQQSAATAGDR